MQLVNDECMGVVVPMPPVLAQVRAIRAQVWVAVRDFLRIGRRPERGRQTRAEQRQAAEHDQRGGHWPNIAPSGGVPPLRCVVKKGKVYKTREPNRMMPIPARQTTA